MKKLTMLLSLILFFILPNLSAQDLPDDLQIGRHTVAEWKYIVDTTWGDGMPTEDKLILFDRFWEAVDKYYAGFVDYPVNWDSVKDHYRPEIEAGVSRGRFAGILGTMGLILKEGHSGAYNIEVYGTKPGRDIPVLILGFYSKENTCCILNNGWFGAALTPINDDNLLVLRSVPDHPLGLEAGDIVLGYNGKPWKELYQLLLKMEFPYTTSNYQIPSRSGMLHMDQTGSSDESFNHKLLSAAGMNWHFFDTLDFIKYNSNDTLHVSTSLLEGKEFNIEGHEQIPVEGIEFPGHKLYAEYADFGFVPPVIYDTILNNSIGYIYSIHEASSDNVARMSHATAALAQSEVKGIIIDLRHNGGGYFGFESGFNPIFNRAIDSCGWYARVLGGDHTDLYNWNHSVFNPPSPDFLNKPIAIITGPGAISMGDYASYFLHSQPMTRSFGKGSNTAYVVMGYGINNPENYTCPNIFWDFGYPEWDFQISTRNFGRIIDGELKYFLHNGFDVDEEIWFTQEAARQQKDNMVERAVEWIYSVAYAENCRVNGDEPEDGTGPKEFLISTGLVNPADHPVEMIADIFDSKSKFIERINLTENTEDWYGNFSAEQENFYYAEFSTHDLSEDSWLTYPGQLNFTSVARPEIFPKVFYLPIGSSEWVPLSLTNKSGIILESTQLKFPYSNSLLNQVALSGISYGIKLKPNQTIEKFQKVTIDENAEEGSEIWLKFDIYNLSIHYWTDSVLLIASCLGEREYLPGAEIRIFPNPMEEYCHIQINGPVPIEKIDVYDLSGRKVFSETKIGTNSYQLTKGDLKKGMYILRVFAGEVYERKLVVR